MLFRVNPHHAAPLWSQVAASVRVEVAAGRLGPGDRLPAAREVADALEVNLHTVLRAYQALREEGLVDMRRGRGAIVTDAGAGLAELRADARRLARRARQLGLEPESLISLMTEEEES